MTENTLTYPGSLHNHTEFSNFRLRDCIIKVEDLIQRAIDLGHHTVAITEHETVSSAIRAEKYWQKVKADHPDFKLILGNEIYLCRNGLNKSNFVKGSDEFFHFILLAKDAIGHRQLRELSTRAWMRSYTYRGMQRVPTYYEDLFDIIQPDPGHVIASTACLGGALARQLLKYRETESTDLMNHIEFWCTTLRDLFGAENFFLEMQPSNGKEQKYVNQEILRLSSRLNIPFIITTDSHYLTKEDRPIHKAYLNSQNGDREVDAFYETTYMMTTEDIRSYMEDELGEDNLQTAFKNIQFIADSCKEYQLKKDLKIPRLAWKTPKDIPTLSMDYYFKQMPELYEFYISDYEEDKILSQIILERIYNDETLQDEKSYKEINACLEDTRVSSEVNQSRWSAYFLNLQNIIDTCWESNSLVGSGRGSGVGFILLYLLGITQINPLREQTKTFRWRFLNPQRVSVLDVDIDIESKKRGAVLQNFRKAYGANRVANVLTLGTETAKAAIRTAARGLEIDVDEATYLSSFIQSDRGISRTLKQTFYGDEENGIAPDMKFQKEMTQNYPKLWEVAQKIEGLVCQTGVHAGGVIFVDEPFTNSTALMKSPKDEIITQFDLHDAEYCGLIKYDILSIEALDKIHICLDLLKEYGYIHGDNLRELYEETVGIYQIARTDPHMWKMCNEHKVLNLFQMNEQSGIQGIEAMKPTSVDDLAILNSAIRLMAQKKGAEMPVHKLARFKANPSEWDAELEEYGLTKEHKKILEPIIGISYGLCIAQEQFMQLVQLPEVGGFDLTWADKLRKSIAKKNPAEYEALTQEFFEVTKAKGCDANLCNYVWNVLIAMSRGYGFNQSHTLAYSLIGLQELNLACQNPIIYWNCACLIADSGGNDEEDEDEEIAFEDDFQLNSDFSTSSGNDLVYEDDSEDDDEENEAISDTIKKNKKVRTPDYGKIATAIGTMQSNDIKITLPDINSSKFTFSPDEKANIIRYGLSGISKVGEDLIHSIMENRPYNNLQDFLNKVKVNKPQMISLIKGGCFDNLEHKDRKKIMKDYIHIISNPKKRVTLQNMRVLMELRLLPPDYDFDCRVYNYNKYLKHFKDGKWFLLDEIAENFFEKNFDMDLLIVSDVAPSGFKIDQKVWDKIYQRYMDHVRPYIKEHQSELLDQINQAQEDELWNKYCEGSLSKWEMDSVSYYFHPHELEYADLIPYHIVNYFNLPKEPILDRKIEIKGKEIPLYKIQRIAGTVLEKDKNKKRVTLLTTQGVVTVKIYGKAFSHYDRQISEKGTDGKKHVIEKSWFKRGNKIIVSGIRQQDTFLAKKYAKTPYHLVELITDIDETGRVTVQKERVE